MNHGSSIFLQLTSDKIEKKSISYGVPRCIRALENCMSEYDQFYRRFTLVSGFFFVVFDDKFRNQ